MPSKPIYVVAEPSPTRDVCVSMFGDAGVFLDPPFDPTALLGREPGVVLVDAAGLRSGQWVDMTVLLPAPEWTLALVDGEHSPKVRTLSVGFATELADVSESAGREGGGEEKSLELPQVLARIARARHDINNPLTAAFVETQILLMGAEEGEVREGLEIIQTQLRRIRDLVAATPTHS